MLAELDKEGTEQKRVEDDNSTEGSGKCSEKCALFYSFARLIIKWTGKSLCFLSLRVEEFTSFLEMRTS